VNPRQKQKKRPETNPYLVNEAEGPENDSSEDDDSDESGSDFINDEIEEDNAEFYLNINQSLDFKN